MNQGYIKLHRQLQDCWIWKKGPFSEGQAWVDLLLLANHKDVKMVIGGELTSVSRGSYHTSIVSLSERWKWSRPRVKRFLTLLERDNMLTQKCTPYGTTLTIVNYGVFQDVGTASVTTNVQPSFSERAPNVTQTINVKNDKNDNNINNNVKQERKKDISEVINYLNKTAEKNFKQGVDATVKMINARFEDGYSFDDFVKVIDCKVSDWKDNPDMNKYLRPSTLFRPGNFENYLNESKGNKYERIKREGGGLLIDSEYRAGLKEQTGRLDFQ